MCQTRQAPSPQSSRGGLQSSRARSVETPPKGKGWRGSVGPEGTDVMEVRLDWDNALRERLEADRRGRRGELSWDSEGKRGRYCEVTRGTTQATRGTTQGTRSTIPPQKNYTEPPVILSCVAAFGGMVRSISGGPLYAGLDYQRAMTTGHACALEPTILTNLPCSNPAHRSDEDVHYA